MIASVRHVCEYGITDYLERPRNEWVISHPGQVVLNSSQVHWTMDVEKHLDEDGNNGAKTYFQFLQKQLDSTVMCVR